ncbi:hypothetical protein [Nocardioides sp.]|uniref:hypothetical protein n=1 Tax=Nocardioides sp. TaxID=35761 RepID=UPI0026094D0B|nr:hypothetical protein [Nocardioides sp.]
MSIERPRPVIEVAGADPDQQLSDHLSEFNWAATPGTAAAAERTVQVRDEPGDLAGRFSGWTWGDAGGMGMVWVRADHRGAGLGAWPLAEFGRKPRVVPR